MSSDIADRVRSIIAMGVEEPSRLRASIESLAFGNGRLEKLYLYPEDWEVDRESVRAKLVAHLIPRGQSPSKLRWKRAAIDILVQRSKREIAHDLATRQMLKIANGLHARSDLAQSFFGFARATRGVGLFEASYGFTTLAYENVELRGRPTSAVRDQLRAITVLLHTDRLDEAQARWADLSDRRIPAGTTADMYDVMATYMSILRGETASLPPVNTAVDARWREELPGSSVLLAGPAEVGGIDLSGEGYDFAAQILRQPSHLERFPALPLSQQILYANSPWQDTVGTRFAEASLKHFAQYGFISLKGRHPHIEWENARNTHMPYSRLFPNGHPNMIPLICLDLLRAGAARVFVVGVDFYASKEPYRSRGTADLVRFRLCTSLSSHNQVENRSIVASLMTAGFIDGDERFREVLAMSDMEYLRVLDEYYGEPQR